MTVTIPDDLPTGFTARIPEPDDVPALAELLSAHQQSAKGRANIDVEALTARVCGVGSWTRRQLLFDSEDGVLAWVSVHDRAAGRGDVELAVTPGHPQADDLAATALRWAQQTGRAFAAQRDLEATALDTLAYVEDVRQQGWLADAGFARTRTWLNMTRPMDATPDLPGPRPGVRVRRVAKHDDGLPVAVDLQVVHLMLEESFEDHFNSYRESFPEFVQRLREDPGHRWDHWWIAEIDEDGTWEPGGALVSSVLSPDSTGAHGSYVDYLGVHRRARGRGVAKALLSTVVEDARSRGRNRVDLEVDADSPTGAHELYRSMGWVNSFSTESWHLDLELPPA